MNRKFCQDTIAANGAFGGTRQGRVLGKVAIQAHATAGLMRFQTTVLAKSKPEPINMHVVQFGLPNHKNQMSFGQGQPQPVTYSIAAAGSSRRAA